MKIFNIVLCVLHNMIAYMEYCFTAKVLAGNVKVGKSENNTLYDFTFFDMNFANVKSCVL